MPTELDLRRLAALAAAVGMISVLLVGAPVAMPGGWDKAAHFAAFSLLTLCLWQATGGRMPVLVIAGVAVLGAMDEWRQAYLPDRVADAKDLVADLCAALCTGALLFMQRKPVCAESSPR